MKTFLKYSNKSILINTRNIYCKTNLLLLLALITPLFCSSPKKLTRPKVRENRSTVIDQNNNLEWQRCAAGMKFDSSKGNYCLGDAKMLTQHEAREYCENFNPDILEYEDDNPPKNYWRLPTLNELGSLSTFQNGDYISGKNYVTGNELLQDYFRGGLPKHCKHVPEFIFPNLPEEFIWTSEVKQKWFLAIVIPVYYVKAGYLFKYHGLPYQSFDDPDSKQIAICVRRLE